MRPKTFVRRDIRRSAVLVTSVCLAAVAAAALAACGSSSTSTSTTSASASGAPKHGGSLTVLEGASFAGAWPGLDPATDTDGAANQSYMNSIFGELFELGTGGKLIPDLATGYSYANGGKTVNITLRHGRDVLRRDAVQRGRRRVQLEARPQRAPAPASPSSSARRSSPRPGRTASRSRCATSTRRSSTACRPTSSTGSPHRRPCRRWARRRSRSSRSAPGPSSVVSDTPSSQLVLKRNPHYWEQGKPYLDKLTFKTVAADEPAYEAMLAGSARPMRACRRRSSSRRSSRISGDRRAVDVAVRHPAEHQGRAVQ